MVTHCEGSEVVRPRQERYSYSSIPMGIGARTEELLRLARAAVRPASPGVAITLETVRTMKSRVFDATGLRVEHCKVVEIGPGQCPQRLRCLATTNDAIGIDTDIVPQRFGEYVKMLRRSPPVRSLKTLGRKLLARDARADAVLAKALELQKLPPLRLLQMSATKMALPDAAFDFACSFSVFEHIDEPEAALAEVARILRPGGVAYISVHLYTCHTGAHDLRVGTSGRHPLPPAWPHLRPEFRDSVRPSAYLNQLSLDAWRRVFRRTMPGARFLYERDDSFEELLRLRAQGELVDYTDDELTTVNFVSIWKKP
jgi:SAM-dependent methyltransferase